MAAPQNQPPPIQPQQAQQYANASSAQSQPPTPPAARFPLYQPPTTPEGVARERERINTLLELNQELLQHASKLQAMNQGGVWSQSQQAQQQGSEAGPKSPSPEYTMYLRCLQANLVWCGTASSGGRPPAAPAQTLAGPALMTAPPNSSKRIIELYEKLQAMFPGWKGVQRPPGGPGSTQSPQGTGPGQTRRSPGVAGPMGFGAGSHNQQTLAQASQQAHMQHAQFPPHMQGSSQQMGNQMG